MMIIVLVVVDVVIEMAMFHLVRDLLRGGRIHWESATAVECAG